MNADELIEQVIDIVNMPPYDSADAVLPFINGANRRIADALLLPDLKDGFAAVLTTVGGMEIDLPLEYHKNLFMARVAGADVDIFTDVVSMSRIRGGISLDTGDVSAVATKRGAMIYQAVPLAATTIELYFYRLPVAMVEGGYPDGANGNDDFDWAIIHGACEKIFARIEDGMEGSKVNTAYHHEMFGEKVGLLDTYCVQQGIEHPNRPSTRLSWLGVR